jgi:hypothetical protein
LTRGASLAKTLVLPIENTVLTLAAFSRFAPNVPRVGEALASSLNTEHTPVKRLQEKNPKAKIPRVTSLCVEYAKEVPCELRSISLFPPYLASTHKEVNV